MTGDPSKRGMRQDCSSKSAAKGFVKSRIKKPLQHIGCAFTLVGILCLETCAMGCYVKDHFGLIYNLTR